KAYSTRVGAGPMPTELLEDTGEIIRRRGNEYGTTTGRPRRTGWFDGVAARQSGRLNGVTEVALTLLDVLDTFETVSVCTGYTMPNGELHHVPAQLDNLIGAQPQWASSAGWMQDTTELRSFDDLPLNAKMYIDVIQNQIGAPVTYVGVGPAREQLLHR
ncbi:MAG: adenylosuccinate synthetase, partial [Thermomicrobiales bacterium]|nr:adenylosuccinate synthetase [Thermomicrobiales bacterium]